MSDEQPVVRVKAKSTNMGMAYFGWWLLVIVGIVCSDANKESRKEDPYRMGAAIACRIGGPSFCPKVSQ